VLLVHTPGQVTSDQPDRIGLLGQWREGLGAVRRSRRLVGVFVVGGLTAFAQGIFLVLFVVFVERQLGASGAAVGLIRGFQAVGGIVGSILVGALALLLGLLALGDWNLSHVTTEVAVYCVLFAVAGMPVAAYATGLITTAQVTCSPDYRGRVFGAFGTAEGGATAVGLAVGGLLGDRLGVVPILDVQALLYVFAGLLSFRLLAAEPDFSQPVVAVSATDRDEKPPRDSAQARGVTDVNKARSRVPTNSPLA
jgi:hypothetical protein